MRNIFKLAAVAVLSIIIVAAPANAQAARHTAPVSTRECPDFHWDASLNGWTSPTCTGPELTVYLAAKGVPMAPPAMASVGQAPTWEQAQAPAPSHDGLRPSYQHTCEPTKAGGTTCYGRDPGPNALDWVIVVGGVTSQVIRATHSRW
jgi:hypothetical protein